jgi:ORF6N domain
MEVKINSSQKYFENRIFTFRGLQVMIDKDLAEMYEVETKVLNQAVKRNIERFPGAFRFALTISEKQELVTNCDRFENLKHSSSAPFAFTEQGVAMLSAVLRSDTAVKVSIQIMNAFVALRKTLLNNAALFQRLDKVELKQIESDQKFEQLFNALESRNIEPHSGVFYDGQVYDAYTFIADLIRKATSSIILIDNYIDDTVLTLLDKRAKQVTATCYTKKISKQLKLDVQKHNEQYPAIRIHEMPNTHDRFLIIDRNELFHIGASLKDLGKKWFAFSKMDTEVITMLEQLNKTK